MILTPNIDSILGISQNNDNNNTANNNTFMHEYLSI